MNRDLEGSMSRHPAGKGLVPCPACDGRGKLPRRAATALISQLVGRLPVQGAPVRPV